MIKAEDMGEFYRVPADNRDLNYAQYWKGTRYLIEDYHSHNTEQLGVEGMKKLLVPLIKNFFGEDVAQMPG
jgi:UDP-glucose 4-epimerase